MLGQHELVEKLPRGALEELCRVFKVDDAPTDYPSQLRLFRSKMADIYTQEGDGYLDYLQLPKFRALPPELSERMLALFRRGWQEYQQFKLNEQASLARKEVEELTPAFDSTDAMHHFHITLLQLYRDSAICPRKSKPQPDPKPNGFLYPSPPQPIQSLQPGQLLYQYLPYQPTFPKVEEEENMPYILNNGMFEMAYPLPNPYYYPPQQHPDAKRKPDSKKPEQEEPHVRNVFAENYAAGWSRFGSYEFIQCACEGRKGGEDRNHFSCNKCEFKYHLACLGLENNPVSAACPLCILRKENIFCRVVKEPIKISWHLHESGKELRV